MQSLHQDKNHDLQAPKNAVKESHTALVTPPPRDRQHVATPLSHVSVQTNEGPPQLVSTAA